MGAIRSILASKWPQDHSLQLMFQWISSKREISQLFVSSYKRRMYLCWNSQGFLVKMVPIQRTFQNTLKMLSCSLLSWITVLLMVCRTSLRYHKHVFHIEYEHSRKHNCYWLPEWQCLVCSCFCFLKDGTSWKDRMMKTWSWTALSYRAMLQPVSDKLNTTAHPPFWAPSRGRVSSGTPWQQKRG